MVFGLFWCDFADFFLLNATAFFLAKTLRFFTFILFGFGVFDPPLRPPPQFLVLNTPDWVQSLNSTGHFSKLLLAQCWSEQPEKTDRQ